MGSGQKDGFRFAIDRGGTFTDIFAILPGGGGVRVLKLLSEDPKHYPDAPTEGIRRIMEEALGTPQRIPLNADLIRDIRMGTTVATNALLERKGTPTALLLNEGFRDLLEIGDQTRPDLFDLSVRKPEQLYSRVLEVKERIIPRLDGEDSCPLVKSPTTGEEFSLVMPLDIDSLRQGLKKLKAEGFKSLAVALLHSYAYPEHEKRIEEIAVGEFGFSHVSLSSVICPMIKVVPRGSTAVLDAYLTPILKEYLSSFTARFEGRTPPVLFMRSDGGLTPMEFFTGSQAILSGPAGGVVGYAQTGPPREPLVGFDMGGTSTDVSRYEGAYEHIHGSSLSGVHIQTPQLDINTVAAGGGSILCFRSGLFLSGPESAGANPGPACYRKGGPLTVTDANLILGRVVPQYFPCIFGPKENEPLDEGVVKEKFKLLTQEINSSLGKHLSIEEAALGFIRVANESMCRPIRSLTQAKGFDTSKHALSCFGGAGGQHACAIARSLGMKRVYIHKYSGILSAYGMALADVVYEEQAPCSRTYDLNEFSQISSLTKSMMSSVVKHLNHRGFEEGKIDIELYLNMRYKGTESSLMIKIPGVEGIKEAGRLFLSRYKSEFGFLLQESPILVDDIRVRGIGRTDVYREMDLTGSKGSSSSSSLVPEEVRPIYFEGGFVDSKVYYLKKLLPGDELEGPCLLIDDLSTILIEPHCIGLIDTKGNLSIRLDGGNLSHLGGIQLDPIQLSIFSHRFMSIAEQMGRILQRTSISTNIKERLDFSCALFGPDGGLVSNAPHIPVHLGAMQDTVKYQISHSKFTQGDVLLANHPEAGGSHLPDLTVITPVFVSGSEAPVFFTANRGHHADIGGSSPGSMPPHSKSLSEEGAQFMSFKLVENGVFREAELIQKFKEPAKHPGCTGSRCLRDNISDLKAQIAANQKGIALVKELIDSYGLEVVLAYMKYIQSNAERSVRDVLKDLGSKLGQADAHNSVEIQSEDFMDDGSRICLRINIDLESGSAVFDFSGTGHQVYGNINTPRAVTYSAVIYSLRCLVGHDIPLNQGVLAPINIKIPEGSLLSPSGDAAVVGGNVLTSQRLVDVILSAFQAAANSQGCCNNVTFGDESFGYYETVAGGSGAGPTWNGTSGVHVHITNTRLTDPEILEKRYPVSLQSFSLAKGTGGDGRYRGGDGIHRALAFRKKLTLSVLTERRVHAPNGICGGLRGSKGRNHLLKGGKKVINLGGKCSIGVEPGDVFVMETPGGGGYGSPEKGSEEPANKRMKKYPKEGGGSIARYDATQISA